MNNKKLATDIAFTFAITLVASVIVTYLYSLIVYGAGIIDWETSFRLSIIFGIVLPLVRQREKK
jgi:uncharacterized membrane protein YraQ (UPF0718 family)